ncbi:MAG: heat-inducible transcription repressor HrcA [Clostridia bacterium]|nr:heat-inducible transcription repressor HrcA [Clostridia bacterium]MBR5426865.1 heat-inducible transcription repressor HrcA [Clostridia bacterium]
MDLTARKEKILGLIVEHFIATGEPVGSKFLSDVFETSISSATIRNEMADLSARGYIEQPYTSAGRIPSQRGYRYYIDNLMRRCEPDPSEQYRILTGLDRMSAEPEKILSDADAVLAELTGCAAVSTTPLDERTSVKRAELIPLGAHNALVVVVTSTGIVKSAVCRCTEGLNMSDAELFYNIANADFIGRRAAEFNLPRLQTIAASLGERALALSPLLTSLYDLAASVSDCELTARGSSNLISRREYEGRAHEVIEFINDGDALKRILRRVGDGVTAFIGAETGCRATEHTSILAAPYKIGGARAGVLSVIGPMRMDYSGYTAILSFVSETVSSLLSENADQ